MTTIKQILRRWLDEPTPEDGLAETLAITIRCARRCAYDLAHAAEMMPATGWQSKFSTLYAERAQHWQGLFSSGASMKSYRLELHREIESRDRIIETLREELRSMGHSGFGPNEVPF